MIAPLVVHFVLKYSEPSNQESINCKKMARNSILQTLGVIELFVFRKIEFTVLYLRVQSLHPAS